MDFLLTNISNNPWNSRSGDLSPEADRTLPLGDNGVTLSLEQVAPLLKGVEIPALAAQRIYHRSDLRELTIQYPCHLRVPVRGGMGITVANRIDAIAACQTLFSRKVEGNFPDYLLVEVDYSLEQQLSLAMAFDEQSEEITLWGSHGQDLANSPSGEALGIEKIRLPGNFKTEDGLLLAQKLELGEAEGNGLVCLLEKLCQMMAWAGLTSCCLDSLALGPEGEVMALAGQFTFGEDSPLKRQAQAAMQTGTVIHPAILSHGLPHKPLTGEARQKSVVQPHTISSNQSLQAQPSGLAPSQQNGCFPPPRVVRLGEGNIAVLSNGFRRTMNTLEGFQLRGGAVAAFVNLQDSGRVETEVSVPELQDESNLPRMAWTDGTLFEGTAPMGSKARREDNVRDDSPVLDAFSLKRQLCQALQALDRLREIKVILINWRSSQLPCRILADALVEYQGQLAHQARRSSQPLSLVVRLAGEGAAAGYQRLMGEEIETEESLNGAIARSMGLARMGRGS